jgi:hypothetical protein
MSGHRINRLGVVLAAALGAAFLAPAPPSAAAQVPDQVLVWNQHAYDELIVGQGPFSVQHMAMVHGAMYDAVNAIAGGYQPYLVAPPAGPTYSKPAAAATAAYEVLRWLLPGQSHPARRLLPGLPRADPRRPGQAGGDRRGDGRRRRDESGSGG